MPKKPATQKQLLFELENLRARLDEAEETLRAIRSGEVDALIVSGKGGEQLFTLKGADHSYRILIEQMSEGALTLTAEGVILYANRCFGEMLKTPLEKVIGSTIDIWMAPASQRILKSLLRQGADERRREQFELIASDGTLVPIILSLSNLCINEMPDSFCLVATDLTEQKRKDAIEASERKREEAALQESKSLVDTVVENVPLMIFLKEATDLRFVIFNRAGEELLGFDRKELLGKNDLNFFPAEQADFFMAKDREVLAGEAGMLDIPEESILTARKGTRLLHTRKVCIRGADGTTKYLLGISEDITERKRAESQMEVVVEALRESEEKYRTVANFTYDWEAWRAPNGIYRYISPSCERITGHTPAEFMADSNLMAQIVHPDDKSKTIEHYHAVIHETQKKDMEFDFRIITPKGETRWISHSCTAVYSETGQWLGRREGNRDITERKRAEEKIKNSLVEKEVLLKEVHHRVKNNLMIIIGLLKMQEAQAANEMLNPLLRELEGRLRSMALVHESLYKSADLAHIDMQNYIETMSAQIHVQFGAERDIRFSVQAVGIDVDLDSAVPFGLILNELLTNTFKHAFPAGRPGSGAGNCEINVIVNQEGGMNVLTVADNGVGLPADLDWEKSKTLGLKLVKMLSRQINGSIELDRSAGTVFRLKFPVAVTGWN